MKNRFNACNIMLIFLLFVVFVSCGNPDVKNNETEVIFSEGVIPIKMTFVDGWSTITSFYSSHKTSKYLSTIKQTPAVHIDNSLKENVDGDNAIDMDLMYPYYINNKDIKSYIPDIDTRTKGKYGNNYVYISNPPKDGFVLVDDSILIRIEIDHWPKSGITPEMGTFFSSIHVN